MTLDPPQKILYHRFMIYLLIWLAFGCASLLYLALLKGFAKELVNIVLTLDISLIIIALGPVVGAWFILYRLLDEE